VASFIQNAQSIISRNLDPLSSGVISFGTIKGGTACNAIADKVSLSGTIRSDTSEGRSKLKLRVENILKNTCEAHGATCTYQFNDGYPALINNELVTAEVIEVAKNILGEDSITRYQTLAAEDFSFFADLVPACYFFLGAGNPQKNCHYPHHHPQFNIDEDALLIGMKMFTKLILK
jgi:amidohydrolase